ncbi:TPA: hypothetical protein ACJIWV_000932 [Enterobacter asburiae]
MTMVPGLSQGSFFHYETHLKSISVNVHIPLDKNASLAVIESRVFEEAKKQLKELAVEF